MSAEAVTKRVPVAVAPRARTVQVGTAFAISGVLLYFGTLFGIYLNTRSQFVKSGVDWIPGDVDMQLTAPTIIAWTFVISLPVAYWAVFSIRQDDRRHAYLAFGLILLLGLMTINQAAFNFEAMGLIADRSRAETLMFLIGGSHIVLTIVGLLFFGFTAFRALAGQYTSKYRDAVQAAAMFWYVIVVLYFIIWLMIYVAK